MCQAIKTTINHHEIIFRFTEEKPCLPILLKSGNIIILPWGNHNSPQGSYPDGGTVHTSHVRSRRWTNHKPKAVRIACESYMLLDKEGNEHWYNVEKQNHYIKGVVAQWPLDDKAYVLVRNRDLFEPDIHESYPFV